MQLKYRPEIDGLRALAVIAVILYHAQIFIFNQNFFKGGFIGVDIFLVISGYLISSLIFKEIEATGKFSFTYFYERRARRILPALLCVMLVSFPFAWMYLLPSDYLDYVKSILFSIGFSSNFYFHFTGLEYGAAEGLLKPFLHTWSLSVEEQFYIIFPIFIIITYNFFKKNLLIILIVGFLLGLFIAHLSSESSPSLSFYFLHTRMWELLAGSILAYVENKKKMRWKFENNILNKSLPLIGTLLVIHAILFYDDNILHPSLYTLSPVIGVCLIIWFANKKELITKIFSSKFFVGIGLVSYSLYLWHYPVFAFFRYSLASGSITKKILIAIFIIIASITTYFLVEKPFRNKKQISFRVLLYLLVITITSLTILSSYVVRKEGFNNRYIFKNVNLDNGFYIKERLLHNKDTKITKFTNLKKRKILIIGNSYGRDLFNIFNLNKDLFTEYEISLMQTEISCLETFLEDQTLCGKKVEKIDINNFENSNIILFSTRWSTIDKNKIDKILSKLKKIDKKIVLTTQRPEFITFGNFTLIDKFILSNKRLPNKSEIHEYKKKYFKSYTENKYVTSTNYLLRSVASKYNLKILDNAENQCDKILKECFFLTNMGDKINFDKGHLTISGAKYIGELIDKNKWLQVD